jgi:hypothetical protein
VLDSQLVEFALDDARSALFFESQFGKAMDVAPDLDRASRDFGRNDVNDRDGFS